MAVCRGGQVCVQAMHVDGHYPSAFERQGQQAPCSGCPARAGSSRPQPTPAHVNQTAATQSEPPHARRVRVLRGTRHPAPPLPPTW